MSDILRARAKVISVANIRTASSRLLSVVSRSDAAFVILLSLVFLSLGLVGILHHEMWRDELQAWLIARDSSSLGDLFVNLRYEGHPSLWYLCLYVLSRFTHEPVAMQLLHLALATAVIFLFARFSPFTRLQKVLFSFGYFPFYEYAIISRNYVLGVLFIFAFCALFHRRKSGYLSLFCVLILLANTSIYGLIVAIALALTLPFRGRLNRSIANSSSKVEWRLVSGLLIFALSVVVTLIQTTPPWRAADRAEQKAETTEVVARLSRPPTLARLRLTLMTVWDSYLPLPNVFASEFWNTNILSAAGWRVHNRVGQIFSLGLIGLSLALFIRHPRAFLLYLSGTLGLLLSTYQLYFGTLRHHGHLFIVFIACLWFSGRDTGSKWPALRLARTATFINRHRNKFVTLILCVHLAAGIFAITTDFRKPFSANKELAVFIEKQQMDDVIIVGNPDYAASPLAAYLGRKIYYLEQDDFGSFIVWDHEDMRPREALRKISELISLKNKDVFLVANYDLAISRSDLSITEVARFTNAILRAEQYHLYLIRRAPTQQGN